MLRARSARLGELRRPAGDIGDLTADLGSLIRAREETRRLADRLVGRAIPSLLLSSSHGNTVDLERYARRSVAIYLYPGANSSPDGGEDSPMVDSAQQRGFAALEPDMSALGLPVVGISTHSQDEQIDSALANHIRHALLSDPGLSLADELGLPTFTNGARRYRRLTIIAHGGRIGKVFYPVDGARNPAQVVAWAKVHGF
ncbi:MAG: redoxin family protein [Solirubrobacteraceae bacterium]